MVATGVFMVAVVTALGAGYAIERRIAKMPLVTAVVVLVFGGLTLWLDDETFIKLKPTIVYLVFAAALLGGLAVGRMLLKPLFELAFQLTDAGWRTLSLRWGPVSSSSWPGSTRRSGGPCRPTTGSASRCSAFCRSAFSSRSCSCR